MSFLTFYLLCVVLAIVNIVFIAWWGYRSGDDDAITLKHILTGFIVFVPVANFLVWFLSTLYIFNEIADEIVIFGKKK